MRLSPMQLSDAELDQQPYVGTPKKIIIATSPRSGSFFLCRLMTNAGLGIPHEYYNPIHARIIGSRLKIDALKGHGAERAGENVMHRYTDALLSHRTRNGVFAAKIQYWQFNRFLRNAAGRDLFTGARVVHLYREDVLGQAMSLHAARVSGKWAFDDTVATPPIPKGNPAEIRGIDRALDDLLNEDREWRRFFAHEGIKPLELAYEDLTRDPDHHLQKIAEYGHYEGELKLGYRETPEAPAGGSGPSRSEIRAHYIKVKRLGRANKAELKTTVANKLP